MTTPVRAQAVHKAGFVSPETGLQPSESMQDVRVILVGRTGLDAALRRDSRVELLRVRTPLDAIGELADPIDASSPRQAVVVVSPDAEAWLGETLPAAIPDFAESLRVVDPDVRLLRIGDPAPGYDGAVGPGATLDDLRRAAGLDRPRTQPAVVIPRPKPAPAESNPARTPAETPRAAAPAPSASPASPGDEAVVRHLLRGKDIVEPLIELLRRRLGDSGARFVPAAPGTSPAGVPVTFEGRLFGHLVTRAPAEHAVLHAAWLADWLRLQDQFNQLREAALTDPLTGAWNRRYFERFLAGAIEQARTYRRAVTVLMFDIDDFKKYNDAHGHAAGDEVLVETVRLLKSVIRPTDRVCRVGGDEFAVIFSEPEGPRVPGSRPPESVFQIARRFQEQIGKHRFPKLGLNAPGPLAISGGLATFPWDGSTPEELTRRADEFLIRSKAQGKNAIVFGPGAEASEP